MLLAAYYGLRRSEVLGIKWSNIDFENGTIRIAHKVVEQKVDGNIDFQTKTISISHKVIEAKVGDRFQPKGFDRMKNQSSNRTLPLIGIVKDELLYQKQRQSMNASALGGAYCHDYDDYVCTDSTGKLLRPNFISVQFGKILKRNGMRHIRFHDLRHTCASLLLKNGIPMKAIQESLGHSTFEVTVNTPKGHTTPAAIFDITKKVQRR